MASTRRRRLIGNVLRVHHELLRVARSVVVPCAQLGLYHLLVIAVVDGRVLMSTHLRVLVLDQAHRLAQRA